MVQKKKKITKEDFANIRIESLKLRKYTYLSESFRIIRKLLFGMLVHYDKRGVSLRK